MFQIDLGIMNFIIAFRSEWLTKALVFFTYLGDWQVIIGLGIIAIIILGLLREKWKIFFLAAALISGEVIKELLKFLIHRQRPDAVFSLLPENGYAFPSGHAVMSVIFYGMVGYFIYQACKKKWQRIILLVATAILVFLIGYSRIYLGVHWISDILAGWLIGGVILAFFIVKLKNIKD